MRRRLDDTWPTLRENLDRTHRDAEVRTMAAPITYYEAQVALAEMIVKLLAEEVSTKPRVSPGLLCARGVLSRGPR